MITEKSKATFDILFHTITKMGNKKVKPNAFSVFMHQFLDKERRKGRVYEKEQWATVAKPHFDVSKIGFQQFINIVPYQEKEKLKRLAKTLPTRSVNVPPKFTSQGVPLEQVEREQQELAEKKRFMERKVKNMVGNAFLDNDLNKREFVFIMANYFYKTHDGKYSPAEIAVAKFSFEDAIYKYYHSFINPAAVTLGYAFTAKDHSERYHRLPPPPGALGEKSYAKVFDGILEVLGVRQGQTFEKSNRHRPCVFIRQQDNEMIESVLDQLSDKQWVDTFDVFDLELLFNELKNQVAEHHGGEPLRITVTNAFIEQDRYDATPDISCDFHEKEDATRHCALSYVRRWFFLFCDHICEKIGVTLVPGRHLPSNAALAPPPPPFDDDSFNDDRDKPKHNHKNDFSHQSSTSIAYTGYSQFAAESDSSDSDY